MSSPPLVKAPSVHWRTDTPNTLDIADALLAKTKNSPTPSIVPVGKVSPIPSAGSK